MVTADVSGHLTHLYFYLRVLRHIRHAINDDLAKSIGQALFSSRLDYANGILSQFNINKLQKVENTLVCVVLRAYNRADATLLLSKLHWLPIERRVLTPHHCWLSYTGYQLNDAY